MTNLTDCVVQILRLVNAAVSAYDQNVITSAVELSVYLQEAPLPTTAARVDISPSAGT